MSPRRTIGVGPVGLLMSILAAPARAVTGSRALAFAPDTSTSTSAATAGVEWRDPTDFGSVWATKPLASPPLTS